jgi:hypothetical protein
VRVLDKWVLNRFNFLWSFVARTPFGFSKGGIALRWLDNFLIKHHREPSVGFNVFR